MLSLFSQLRPVTGWISKPLLIGSAHRHPSGWQVHRAQHPTANRPWIVYSPDGQALLTEAALGWAHLPEAKAAVEAIVSGVATAREDEKGRLIFSPPQRTTENAEKSAGVGE